jgi:hypothetical protein
MPRTDFNRKPDAINKALGPAVVAILEKRQAKPAEFTDAAKLAKLCKKHGPRPARPEFETYVAGLMDKRKPQHPASHYLRNIRLAHKIHKAENQRQLWDEARANIVKSLAMLKDAVLIVSGDMSDNARKTRKHLTRATANVGMVNAMTTNLVWTLEGTSKTTPRTATGYVKKTKKAIFPGLSAMENVEVSPPANA